MRQREFRVIWLSLKTVFLVSFTYWYSIICSSFSFSLLFSIYPTFDLMELHAEAKLVSDFPCVIHFMWWYLFLWNSGNSGSWGFTGELWQGAHIPSIYEHQKDFCPHCCQSCCQSLWTRWDPFLCIHLIRSVTLITYNPRSLHAYYHVYLLRVGLATRLPRPNDLIAYAESCMYSPNYRNYRWTLVAPMSSSWRYLSLLILRWPFLFFVLFWKKISAFSLEV